MVEVAPTAQGRRGAEILSWPGSEERRQRLARDGVPRLLVLEAGTTPPPTVDLLEDWIWLPADERDVFSRLRRLEARVVARPAAVRDLRVEDGVLVADDRLLRLPKTEAALLALLVSPPETLRTREELGRAAWGDEDHARRSLDSRIFVLRRRVAPLGLAIPAIRGRGFLLTRDVSRMAR